jgi:DNA-binding NtrC family response regulator
VVNPESSKLLVVDDDPDLCELLEDCLTRRGYEVASTGNTGDALSRLRSDEVDVVLADINLEGESSGLDLCRRIAADRPDLPVIMITAYGTMETAVGAIRAGAYDFITKPISMDALLLTVKRGVEHKRLQDEVKRLKREVLDSRPVDEILGASGPMRRVYDLISQVSSTDASVLITGESGTGKELAARAIHTRSVRGNGPFVAINCAAMPATLLESELFGHVRGAFTDAKKSRTGLFVQATGGTLFLDEIGEMAVEMQAKLLRVLQEHKVRPVGGDTEVPFDTRIIAATNRDLDADVDAGRFREDLFYRINVVRIEMPPLRSRGEDVLGLAQFFLERAAQRSGKEVHGVSPAAARKLLDYDWPGNVRELENSIERAVALTRSQEIAVEDLPDKIRDHQSSQVIIHGDDPDKLPTLDEVEQRYIHRVLKAVGGNKTHASRVLGMDRRTLYRKLEKYEGRTSGPSAGTRASA